MSKKPQKEYSTFELLSSDEWDHVYYLIKEELIFLNNNIKIRNLSKRNRQNLFINNAAYLFENDLKNKLQEKDFDKNLINNLDKIRDIIENEYYFDCPKKVLKYSSDKTRIYLDEDIKSALRSLLAIYTFRDDIENTILTDNEHYEIFLKTFLLLVEIFRAGNMKNIIEGIARIEGRSRGGLASGRLPGILLAVKKILETRRNYSAEKLWKVFEKDYSGKNKAIIVGNYRVFFSKDDPDKDLLFQLSSDGTSRNIRRSAFQGYVKKAKLDLKIIFK